MSCFDVQPQDIACVCSASYPLPAGIVGIRYYFSLMHASFHLRNGGISASDDKLTARSLYLNEALILFYSPSIEWRTSVKKNVQHRRIWLR